MHSQETQNAQEFKALQSINHPNLWFMMDNEQTLLGFYWRTHPHGGLNAQQREAITERERSKYFNSEGMLKSFQDINATQEGVA